MKRGMTLILGVAVLSILMIGMIYAGNSPTISGNDNSANQVVGNGCGDVSPDSRNICCEDRGYNSWNEETGVCENQSTHASANNTNYPHENAVSIIKSRISGIRNGECPAKCTCTGEVIKCEFSNGTREMSIIAGNSGNFIFQVKNANASTSVTLYRAEDGKIYGVFRNNETRVVRMLPDQVREKIGERIKARLDNENITLDDNGNYTYSAFKEARLFFFIPVRIPVSAKIDAETGKLDSLKSGKWWSFLARDVNSQQVVGASCGTVTPGQNDACCQTKGYDFWNATSAECGFNNSG